MQGVYYASPSGLAVVNPYGVGLVTKETIGWRDWNELVHPANLRAVRYAGVYIAFDTSMNADQFGAIIDPTDKHTSFAQIANATHVDNIQVDPWSGCVMLVGAGGVYQWDPPGPGLQIPWLWRSKKFHVKYKLNFGVMKVYFDDDAVGEPTIAALAQRGNPFSAVPNISIGADVPVHVKVWADDRLVYEQDLFRSGDQISMPSGFKAEGWQIELSGQVNCQGLFLGISAKDLRAA